MPILSYPDYSGCPASEEMTNNLSFTLAAERSGLLVQDTSLLSTSAVPELNTFTVRNDYISFGASMSMADVEDILEQQVHNSPEDRTRYFSVLMSQISEFTAVQIKNTAVGFFALCSYVTSKSIIFTYKEYTYVLIGNLLGCRI